jgi:sugar phosphate isomerase/epimerase
MSFHFLQLRQMTRLYSLAHLTVLDCAPPEMVYLAARAGYDFVSLRLIPIGTPGEPRYVPQDKQMLRRTKQALKETGLRLLDLELARIVDGLDTTAYLPAMEAAAELGAKHVITSAWTTRQDDRTYLIDSFAAICDMAKPLGLTVNFEFPSFSRIGNLMQAADIVDTANRYNGGILIDMLYMHFGRIKPEELDSLPPQWFRFVHLCDAPAAIPATKEGQIHIARGGRLYPGEGAIDIAGILNRLPPVPISIELPNTARARELGFEEHARRCLHCARSQIEAPVMAD